MKVEASESGSATRAGRAGCSCVAGSFSIQSSPDNVPQLAVPLARVADLIRSHQESKRSASSSRVGLGPPHHVHSQREQAKMGTGGSSAKQRKTRKFAEVKRMVNPKDMRLSVSSSRSSLSLACQAADARMRHTGKRTRRSRRRRRWQQRRRRSTECESPTSYSVGWRCSSVCYPGLHTKVPDTILCLQ